MKRNCYFNFNAACRRRAIGRLYWLGFVILFLAPFAALGQGESQLFKAGINLIPFPQEVQLADDRFSLPSRLIIAIDRDFSEKDRFAVAELQRRLVEDWAIESTLTHHPLNAHVVLTRKGADRKLGNQSYELDVTSTQIVIKASDEPGLFYGVQTFGQLIQDRGNTFVRCIKIRDWPHTVHRAVHYDTKHHQDTREYVEGFIRDLAKYKINILVWEWEDKFDYPSRPEIGAPGAFTMQEMQEITRYAQNYHVQIVPLVQGLGHVSFILKWPQYAHLREIPASNWEFDPLNEGSYELLFDLWADAIEATPGSMYIHIGSDETFELGQGPTTRQKAEEIGRNGLYHLFVGKSARHLQKTGREVMVWERPMGWTRNVTTDEGVGKELSSGHKVTPQEGIVLTEAYGYETPDLKYAREAKALGFQLFAYDPNAGIECLFVPYIYRKKGAMRNNPKVIEGSLENSYKFFRSRLGEGIFDGMICTSWDDSGLHNQVWMLRFVTAAEFSWNARSEQSLAEFTAKYFKNYYGDNVTDMEELFMLLNEGAYFYMESFERNVWHHGEIGKTHIPDLPRTDVLEYNPYWKTEYADRVKLANEFQEKMARALQICQNNLEKDLNNTYDFEVFASIARLIGHTAETYLDLSALEHSITKAHQQRFLDLDSTLHYLDNAQSIVDQQLERRKDTYDYLVRVWEKTRFPKGMETEEKKFFFQQDRARHFANRTPDLTYHIYDEQLLGLEEYLEKLKAYRDFFYENIVNPEKSHLSRRKSNVAN